MCFKNYQLVLIAVVSAFIVNSAAGQADSVLFQAMHDEIGRNMSELVMENLERPYFMGFTIDDYQNLTISSTLGALTASNLDRGRYLTVDLRVGNQALDNSNFVAGFYDYRQNYFKISLENDYDAIRNLIYLSTDRLYKSALKTLSQKRAYLQARIVSNRPDDFIMQPATKYISGSQAFDINKAYFEDLAAAASAVFREYPDIISSEITITAGVNNQYLDNSIGTRALRGDRLYVIDLEMKSKSADGEDVADGDKLIVNTFSDLPSKKVLITWARANADRMAKILEAQSIDEYTGPVILDGDAAGEYFRQLFAKNVSDCPAPTYDKEQMAKRFPGPEFANKIKRRIMPEFLNVYDDPTVDHLGKIKLLGRYGIDDAGGIPRRIQLVENGKLINLLIGVAPTKQIKEPNGHARGAVSKDISARPANMIIQSSNTASFANLKKSMLEICQDMGLEYGLIIRKLSDPNSVQSGGSFFGGSGGPNSALSSPLEAYKVYADGREESVRNLDFSNVTIRILKDIVQTGNDDYCYNYLIGNDYEMPVSLVCPSILVEEMELKKSEGKVERQPILPSPLAKK